MKISPSYEQIEKFKAELDRCTKCGFCMSACPVYREERVESSVARGKVMLIRALLDSGLALTDEMAEQLNRCTLCRTCAQNCPAAAEIPAVVAAARARIPYFARKPASVINWRCRISAFVSHLT